MKNTFGNNLTVTVFGESHGPYIGFVMDGVTPGIKIDDEFIKHQLMLRRPSGAISTKRVEPDDYVIASGAFKGYTTGTPLTVIIPNTNTKSKDYDKTEFLARPGHADFTAECKYHGFQDYHGGGHFSGRITAAIVAAGAILIPALKEKGIVIGTHIASLGGIKDVSFSDYEKELGTLNNAEFPVIDESVKEKMIKKIEDAASQGDSVGGVLETVVLSMPAGVGEPMFDSIESMLSHALFSIPAVKGVEFGAGFDMVDAYGSEFNDEFYMDGKTVRTRTNNNGGINGGISNGMPITIRTAVKPTPSIYKKQNTIDYKALSDKEIQIEGRHDPAIIHRARVVVDSITAITIADMLIGRFGTDFLSSDVKIKESTKEADYFLIGAKLGHSYSRLIHDRIGLYKYDLKEIAEEDLDEFFKKKDFKGLNVTIPYKEKVMKYLDEIDDKAKAIGCVNTIVNDNGVLKGYNTDYYGLKALIMQSGLDFINKKVLVLGNGGTAKTARAVLKDLGASPVITVSRKNEPDTISYTEASFMHKDTFYIVNTTPAGMYPNVDDMPPIDISDFTFLQGVTDVIYNPSVTKLVKEVRQKNLFGNNGLYMLVKQAVKASELFTGINQDDALVEDIYREISASINK